ncbi:hypothetical protein D3C72_634650 [compost metagenome]
MQTMIQLTTLRDAPSRSQLEIRDHPVFQALPPAVQDRALTNGRLKMLAPGEEVDDDEGLFFVLAGVLGLFPGRQRICVSLVVAGSVYGWDQALDAHAPQSTARAIVETLVCRVPAESVLAPLGRDWLTRLVARQAPTRLHFMAAEAACNASHLVTERLAKWLVRLHCGANGAPLRLTQADFAAMLGVQRTSINAAARRLQELGAVRFGRGKVQVIDLARLRQVSCGCGEVSKRPESLRLAPAQTRVEPSSWEPARLPRARADADIALS